MLEAPWSMKIWKYAWKHPSLGKLSISRLECFKADVSRFLQLSARTWLWIIVGVRGILVCVSVLYLLAFFSYSPPWPLSWGVPGKLLIAWNYAVDEIPAFLLTISFPLCCQCVFGYLSGNFFLTWNHLFMTSSSWLTTALFIVAKYWK